MEAYIRSTDPHHFPLTPIEVRKHAALEATSVNADTGWVSSGGMTNVIFLPLELCRYVKRLARAIGTCDKEAIFEYLVRTLNVPTGVAIAIGKISLILSVLAQGSVIFSLGIASIPLGALFILLELAVEIYRLCRTMVFRYRLDLKATLNNLDQLTRFRDAPDLNDRLQDLRAYVHQHKAELIKFGAIELLEAIDRTLNPDEADSTDQRSVIDVLDIIQRQLVGDRLQYIESTYFMISAGDHEKYFQYMLEMCPSDECTYDEQVKFYHDLVIKETKERKEKLAQKIGNTYTATLLKEEHLIVCMLFDKESTVQETAIDRGTVHLKRIYEQSNKTLIVHFVGLLALALGAISLGLTTVACPFLVPVILFLVGFALELWRYYANDIFIESDGYEINFSKILPECMQSKA